MSTAIPSRKLCVCFACCLYLFFLTPTKTVNFHEWFESLESFMSIISILLNIWIWMIRLMNHTYFECYEFDVNFVLILIATCTYKSCTEYVCIRVVEFQYRWLTHAQNFMSTYEYRKNNSLLISGTCLVKRVLNL